MNKNSQHLIHHLSVPPIFMLPTQYNPSFQTSYGASNTFPQPYVNLIIRLASTHLIMKSSTIISLLRMLYKII